MEPKYFSQLIEQPAQVKQFKDSLPPHIPVERFIAAAKAYFAEAVAKERAPKLANASERSVLLALHKAAKDGLLMDGTEACFLTFGQEAQYCPMVWGLMKLVRNSGEVSKIEVHQVFEKEFFEPEIINGQLTIRHKPLFFAKKAEKGARVGVYAVATLKDGNILSKFMNSEDLAQARGRAKTQEIWNADPEGMECKTVLRKIVKFLPKSAEIRRIEKEEEEEMEVAEIEGGQVATTESSQKPEELSLKDQARIFAKEGGLPALKSWFDSLPITTQSEASEWIQDLINEIKTKQVQPAPAPAKTKQTSAKLAAAAAESIEDPNNWDNEPESDDNNKIKPGDIF